MNKFILGKKRGVERLITDRLTAFREKLWYDEDVVGIREKKAQCDIVPLSKTQKKEIRSYWKGLVGVNVPTDWHEYFYSRNGWFSVRYVPTCLYHSTLIYRLNLRPLSMAYTDKNAYDNYFIDVRRPETLVRNVNGYFFDGSHPISEDEALEICRNVKDAIIKPSMIGKWGTGVRLFSSEEGMIGVDQSLKTLFSEYKDDFIIQRKVVQHHRMALLNPTSLNTLRVLSYHRGDEVFIQYVVARIGRKGKLVDNETAGGINADVDLARGCIRECAYGKPSEKKIFTTDVGTVLAGYAIPAFEELIATVKSLHRRLPYFNLIGWDFAIDEMGHPVLIEWNRCPDLSQTAHGPAFGDMTEEIVRFALTQPDTFNAKWPMK